MRTLRLLSIILLLAVPIKLFSQEISIAAAADLRFAMDEIVKEFGKTNPNVKVNVIYGSSGNLYQQIVNHAPFNIFFSADISYAKKIDSLKLSSSSPKLYAIGHLVLWSSSIDITKGLDVLKSPEVKKIAIANPAVAPYGKRAVECLKYYNLLDKISDKIVKGENVSQAAQFVLTGNSDVGIIALSLALSPEMATKGKYYLIDEKCYSTQEQAYIVTQNSATDKNVQEFIKFVDSPRVRQIFEKFGFKLPKNR